jgi:hypothetical protein
VDSRGRALARVEPRSTRLSNRSQDRWTTKESLEITLQILVTNISPPFEWVQMLPAGPPGPFEHSPTKRKPLAGTPARLPASAAPGAHAPSQRRAGAMLRAPGPSNTMPSYFPRLPSPALPSTDWLGAHHRTPGLVSCCKAGTDFRSAPDRPAR